MRTPGQFQQNFPRELAVSEVAALAGADQIQFRIDHAREDRVIGVLKAVRDASGWETRPSPRAKHTATGNAPVRGRGVSAMFRSGTYWACVCEIAVTPETGQIVGEKYTIAVDPGIVVNPLQLKRQVEGGAVMGISHALLEEAKFDESGITVSDWRSYPILKMADIPEIKVVLINRPEVGAYRGGSEAANALAAPAIAAALHDATGKIARRLPLRPEYVKGILRASWTGRHGPLPKGPRAASFQAGLPRVRAAARATCGPDRGSIHRSLNPIHQVMETCHIEQWPPTRFGIFVCNGTPSCHAW